MKKGNIFFVPDHRKFDLPGTVMVDEMLDYTEWPICNYEGTPASCDINKIYKDAFNAMDKLPSIIFKISMEVQKTKRYLFLPKRVWCQVSINDDKKTFITQLSHDTRHDNAAFRSLIEWPEKQNFRSEEDYEGDETEFQKVVEWSSVENWEKFLRAKIATVANDLIVDSGIKMMKAQEEILKAQKIYEAFIK